MLGAIFQWRFDALPVSDERVVDSLIICLLSCSACVKQLSGLNVFSVSLLLLSP